ncbi:DNA methyltransferase [Sinorhizobium meliloti]
MQASLEACGFQIRSQIIWAKDRFALSRGDYHWQHEPCWYAVRQKGNWCGDRSQSTLWTIPSRDDSGHGHSTQKPVEAMRRPMQNNSSAGQAVYDPFVGSGTTLIAAEMDAGGAQPRNQSGLCRRCRDALAGFHRRKGPLGRRAFVR